MWVDKGSGEQRPMPYLRNRMRSAANTRLTPATRMLIGCGLTLAGLVALAILSYAPDRFAAATPMIADLEDWLIWGDLQSY